MEYEFSAPPSLGHIHTKHGQRYQLIEIRPYVRKTDGADSYLLTWRSVCPDCGAAFTVPGGMAVKALTRRCEAHRAKFVAASAEARLASRDALARGRKTARANRKARRRLGIGDLLA